jgi:gamma-glutamyltranspeptidase/glutathione hydrolase
LASDPVAQEAAEDFLTAGGSATGAVLSGFFAAAGAHAGVLWGPLSLIVSGVGLGARAFDGRLIQPGLGHKRPRGKKQGDPVEDAARVPVPGAVAAALVAHAYDGGQRLGTVMKPGLSRARQSGATGRHELLTRIRAAGAAAMGETSFVRELLRVAGPAQGGQLTAQDFTTREGIDHEVLREESAGETVLRAPWAGEVARSDEVVGRGAAIIAIDQRGGAAALAYRRVNDGFVLDAMDLELPLGAAVVEHGVPRVKPGTRLRSPTPIEIAVRDDLPIEVRALPAALDCSELEVEPRLVLRRDPATRRVVAL